jgi:hypothetical protein
MNQNKENKVNEGQVWGCMFINPATQWRLGGWRFKARLSKKLVKLTSINKSCMVEHTSNPNYEGDIGKRITVCG